MTKLITYTDGGSRGNPGPAAYGAAIFDTQGNEIKALSKYLGITTNNQAEYQGVHAAISACVDLGADEVEMRMDSQLIVRQMTGEYRVKDAGLAVWYAKIQKLMLNFKKVTFHHVRREQNKRADALVNFALDREVGK